MFRKKAKKVYPEGTFIPMRARVCAILQLCLAFSAILWTASQPFVGEIFTLKSRLLYYQDAMGIPSGAPEEGLLAERRDRNSERFNALPGEKKSKLLSDYASLQKLMQRTFFEKLSSTAHLFIQGLSSYEIAWILLSIALPLMLLKKVEGAREAVWLIPLLVAAYAVDVRIHGQEGRGPADAALFPSESELVANYLNEPLDPDVFEQRAQLMKAWRRYLVVNWAGQEPAQEASKLERQAEEGEYRFNLARLETHAADRTPAQLIEPRAAAPSLFALLLYFFWNTYFAFTSWKYTERSPKNT